MPKADEIKKFVRGEDKMAELMGVHRNTINKWCVQGKLTFERIGRIKYFDPKQDPAIKEG